MLDVKVIPSATLIDSARDEMAAAPEATKQAMLKELDESGGTIDEEGAYLLGYFTRMVQESMEGR